MLAKVHLLFLFLAFSIAAAAGPPRFTYSPRIVKPGEAIRIVASEFPPDVAFAGVSIADEDGNRTILGAAAVVAGGFNRPFTIPASAPPGRYLVHVVDNTGKISINLIGTLAVAPIDQPSFSLTSTTSFPGGTIEVKAGGFEPGANYAAVALTGPTGAATFLGFAGLAGGGFTRTFAIPAGLAPDASYNVYVVGQTQQFAEDLSGPLTLAFNSVKPTVAVGVYPIGVKVSPFTNQIYVPNGGDNTVSVIDGVTNTVQATIPVGELPCALGVNLLTNRAYIANVNSDSLSVIDGASLSVVGTIDVGSFPCAVGVVSWADRIYVGNYGENTVSVVDGASGSVIATIPTPGPPFGLDVNPVTNRIYVAAGDVNQTIVIDGVTNAIVASIPVGAAPDAVGVNTATNRIYIGNYFGDSVSVIDGATDTVIATIPVGKEASGVAANPISNRVYVGNYATNTVSIIDGASNQVIATRPVGFTPDGMAVNPLTGRAYSVNSNTNNVSVIQE